MSTALLATKFFAPLQPRNAVLRPLLAQRLDEGLGGKLTLVCAAAGFGKSTLVSQWAQDCAYPSAWLQLDGEDRDPTRFLDYLVASVQASAPTVGNGIAALLHGAPSASAETVLTMLLNQMASMAGKLVLVLDDYHLAASAAVNEALAFFIDHMPAQLHLVLVSREAPDLALGRLRAQGQLTEIRQQELRFAVEEATRFLAQGLASVLSQPQIFALEARTEGWIAGLKLAAISLRQHTDPESFIAAFTGSHRFVQNYLVEEVLRQQPRHVQSFMLRTSILERMCGPLRDAVLQGHGGQEMLAQLEQANLFIEPLDTERRWYRYHHLFADLLRQRLLLQASAEPLHLRASQWYEDEGLELEAFHQATAARDIAGAIKLIEGRGMPLYFRGEAAPVAHRLAAQARTLATRRTFRARSRCCRLGFACPGIRSKRYTPMRATHCNFRAQKAARRERSSQLSGRSDSESGLGADVLRARLMLVQHQYAEADALLARTEASAKTRRFMGRMQDVTDPQVQRLLGCGDVNAAAAIAQAHQRPIAKARALWRPTSHSSCRRSSSPHPAKASSLRKRCPQLARCRWSKHLASVSAISCA